MPEFDYTYPKETHRLFPFDDELITTLRFPYGKPILMKYLTAAAPPNTGQMWQYIDYVTI